MFDCFKDAYAFIESSFCASIVVALLGAVSWELAGSIADLVLPWLRRKLKLDKGGESDACMY